MSSDDGKRERETIGQQWRRYGELPFALRWSCRAGMILGALLVAGVLAVAARVIGWVLVNLWRATGWS